MARWPRWVPVLIGSLAILVYVESLSGPFQYDDWLTVAAKPASGAPAQHAADSADGFRPVTAASHAIDRAWTALAPNLAEYGPAAGHHLTAVALHALAAVLVWWMARLWWADDLAAAAAGVVFAVHPFNAEAVNYISARSSVLSACAELLALGAYTAWRRRGGRWWHAASLVGAALALGAKESALTIPVLLWLIDATVISPRDSWRDRAGRLWPWGALVAVYAVARWFAVSDVSGGADYSAGDRVAALATGVWIIGLAARDFWWPMWLSVEHGVEPLHGVAGWVVLAGAAAACGVLLIARRRGRAGADGGQWAVFSLAWWTAAAFPVLALPFITHVALYLENRFYLAAAGFTLFAGRVAASGWRAVALRAGVPVSAGLALAVVLGLGALSHARTTVWQSEIALWRDATAKAPRSALAHAMLGAAYLDQNRPDLAVEPLERATRLDPRYPLAATNLGAAYVGVDRWGDAIAQFQSALAVDPDYHQARRNLALAYQQAGQWAEAIAQYEALALRAGEDDDVRLRIGALALQMGDLDRASSSLTAALARDPNLYPAWFNLGLVEARKGRVSEAERAFERARSLNPNDADVYYQLGVLATHAGRADEAARAFEAALARNRRHFLAYFDLARLEDARGRRDAATEHYRRFLETAPTVPAWASARAEAQARVNSE
ncbi:MAG: tetratricopeptide repeat protein [Nitrospirota bacterium]